MNIHEELFRLKKELDLANQTIRELKAKTRFKSYMDMAKENLALAEQLHAATKELEDYKSAFLSFRSATPERHYRLTMPKSKVIYHEK